MAASAVTPLDIWTALRQAGASPIQAAGIMGNMQYESGMNPESGGTDTNGYWAGGLVSWNTEGYTNARSLVTGNPTADLKSQIQFLVQTGAFGQATGTDPGSAAANFAHNYERCAACGYQGGSDQIGKRASAAQAVYAAAQSGDWSNVAGGSGSGSYTLTGATKTGAAAAGSDTGSGGLSDCAIKSPSLPLVGGSCLLTKGNLKALKGGILLAAGGAMFIVGGLVLVAYGFQKTGADRAATTALRATPAKPLAKAARARRTAGAGQKRAVVASQRQSARRADLDASASARHARSLEAASARSEMRRAEIRERGRQARKTDRTRTQGQVTRTESRAAASRYRRQVADTEPF